MSHMCSSSSQRGVSLVGLLVGTAISLLMMVAVLQLSQSVYQVTGASGKDAVHDSRLDATLLAIGAVLQNAGFGIDKPQEYVDIQLLANVQLHQSEQMWQLKAISDTDAAFPSQALLWRSQTLAMSNQGGAFLCEGLYVVNAPDAANQAIYYLETSNADCTNDLHNVRWRQRRLLASEVQLHLEKMHKVCTPLGHTLGSGHAARAHVYVKVTARSSSQIYVSDEHCLRNFEVTAS